LNDGQITIKDLITIGVGRRNAFIIKKYPADLVPATTGPKPKIPVKLAGTITAKVSDGTYKGMAKAT
jgi:hypothetical protein